MFVSVISFWTRDIDKIRNVFSINDLEILTVNFSHLNLIINFSIKQFTVIEICFDEEHYITK